LYRNLFYVILAKNLKTEQMKDIKQVTISNEEYRGLLGIAFTARTLIDYSKEGDIFQFMVDASVKSLEEKLNDEGISHITGIKSFK
jgi:hypothetical protein